MNPLIEQLQHILGALHVLSDGNLEAYEKDWRGRVRGPVIRRGPEHSSGLSSPIDPLQLPRL